MKKSMILFAICLCAISLSAQNDAEYFKNRYDRQVRNVGADGVGVETIIDRWAEAYPEDVDMLLARFSYYYAKSQSSEVVPKDMKKYLGKDPVISLKDSLGNDVAYFEDTMFEDSLFAKSLDALNQASALDPDECKYRLFRISALMSYEKEDPALAVSEINKFVDEYRNSKKNPHFIYDGELLDDATFWQAISEYCLNLFNIGSDAGYKYFFELSKKMNKLYPKVPVFINNLGSYYQAYEKNYRKAQQYYKKTLKIEPDNYAATTNMRIIRSLQSRKDQSSK